MRNHVIAQPDQQKLHQLDHIRNFRAARAKNPRSQGDSSKRVALFYLTQVAPHSKDTEKDKWRIEGHEKILYLLSSTLPVSPPLRVGLNAMTTVGVTIWVI